VEMAAYFPQSDASLLNISGVGQVKMSQYGETFLALIKSYCHKHHLLEKRKRSGNKLIKVKKSG
jgi:ATP-dependent DNA helicase RecQ